MGRKLTLGLSGALLLGFWILCAIVYVVRSRTGSYDSGFLAPFVLVPAVFTVAAAAHQRLAWRREAGMIAAALSSFVAAVTVFVLLIVLLWPGR